MDVRQGSSIGGIPRSGIGTQFVRFAAVGVVGTTLHYCILLALVEGFSVDPVLASTVGAVGGAIVNYLLNYYFTFASRRSHIIAAPLFMAVAATGLALNAAVMAACVNVLALPYLFAQIIATGIVLGWTFSVNRFLTFRV